MRVTSLDAGAGRLIQFSLVYNVPIRLEKEDLENGTRHVAAKWPRSNAWIDPLRRHMVKFVLHKGVDILRVKEVPQDFRDYVAKVPNTRAANSNFIDISLLDDLFKGWLGITNLNVFERVLTIKAVQFNDQTVIRFKVQHPLTDISGLLQIIATFCEGLKSDFKAADLKEIEQSQKRMYTAEDGKAGSITSSSSTSTQGDADALHNSYWNRGWFTLLGTGLRIWTSIGKQRARSESMAFIPQNILDKWKKTSRDSGVYITENDLVMAWIHKCLIKYINDNKLEKSPDREHFAFIMNIEKLLDNPERSPMGNPWIVVPVPEKASGDDDILDHAAEVRDSINKARQREVVQSILEQHKGLHNMPYLPRHHGWTGAPHLVVTSWIHQALYDFDFSTVKQPEKAAPSFVQGSQHIFKLLQQLQIPLPGLVTILKGKTGGIWMAGDLEVGLWKLLLKLPA